uniref:Uncharacterized protein n=1 Tax=Glossina pallidipes TaxID=7398 RepID=A0A1A9ZW33_GLOPL
MNHINCAITKCRSVTPKILPAITELIPTGVNHITHVTIFITTSNIAAKKSTTTCPLEPIVPRNVPNTKQKNTIPNVLVPLRYCMTRIRAGSVISSRCASAPCSISMLSSTIVSSTFSFTVSLNACRTAGLGTKLSNKFTAARLSVERSMELCKSGSPGWISVTNAIPKIAFSSEVLAKYTKVRRAILPFIRAFKLAEPAIKLDITKASYTETFLNAFDDDICFAKSIKVTSCIQAYVREARIALAELAPRIYKDEIIAKVKGGEISSYPYGVRSHLHLTYCFSQTMNGTPCAHLQNCRIT